MAVTPISASAASIYVRVKGLHGWESSVSVKVSKLFAIEGDVSGHYKSVSSQGVSATISDYTFAGGPRINFRPVFGHVLVGGDRVSASAFGFTASHDGLSVAAGGGIEWPMSGHWALRVSADYVLGRHNVSIPGVTSTTVTLNSVRGAAGIVYNFGGETRSASVPKVRRAAASRATVTIPQLGIEVETSDAEGATIISVPVGSAGERSGLRSTDVIKAIDDTPVRSAQDLLATLAGKNPGTKVKVRYLRSYWESETSVTLQ